MFLFGFAKNDRDNVTAAELELLKTNAAQWLGDASKIAKDAKAGILVEVKYGDDKN